MIYVMALLASFFSGQVFAHEWVPTYPKLELSSVPSVLRAEMHLLNRREDVEYYSFEVFDEDFEPVPFAATQRTVRLKYLDRKNVNIYIRVRDADKVVYICSRSEIVADKETRTVVSSSICSKVK